MKAHGQKTRHLDRSPSWRRAWQVVADPGTALNTAERLSLKYTWFRDKYSLKVAEVGDNPPLAITFDFLPVPKLTYKTIKQDITLEFIGYYTGNHSAPHPPKIQAYDNTTGWQDITGGALTVEATVEEKLNLTLAGSGDWWAAGTNNVRIRILHPPVAGNTAHRLYINHMGLGIAGVTTTTTTTTTSTTTTGA